MLQTNTLFLSKFCRRSREQRNSSIISVRIPLNKMKVAGSAYYLSLYRLCELCGKRCVINIWEFYDIKAELTGRPNWKMNSFCHGLRMLLMTRFQILYGQNHNPKAQRKKNRVENWLLQYGPTLFGFVCIFCHNFWTNYDLDLFSTSKWPSDLQFCERYKGRCRKND